MFINPLARHNIGTRGLGNEPPSVIVDECLELLSHGSPPLRIRQSSPVVPRDRGGACSDESHLSRRSRRRGEAVALNRPQRACLRPRHRPGDQGRRWRRWWRWRWRCRHRRCSCWTCSSRRRCWWSRRSPRSSTPSVHPEWRGGGRSWGRAGRGCSRCQADNRPNLEDSRVLEELLQVSTGARLLDVDKRQSDRSRGRCCSARHRHGVT